MIDQGAMKLNHLPLNYHHFINICMIELNSNKIQPINSKHYKQYSISPFNN